MGNEFEELSAEEAPRTEFSGNSSPLSAGSSGTAYDWSNAPANTKAPPRVNMKGMTVTIKKADIILPPLDSPWDFSKDKTKELKKCQFILYYDYQGQQEHYSGVRVFKAKDGKYSHPSITKDGLNQASKLLCTYAKFKGKSVEEVGGLREFLGFLNGQPKALITTEEVKNPNTGEKIVKNIVEAFV